MFTTHRVSSFIVLAIYKWNTGILTNNSLCQQIILFPKILSSKVANSSLCRETKICGGERVNIYYSTSTLHFFSYEDAVIYGFGVEMHQLYSLINGCSSLSQQICLCTKVVRRFCFYRLREAVASLHGPFLKRDISPVTEVIITHGAYESLQCCFLGLVGTTNNEQFLEFAAGLGNIVFTFNSYSCLHCINMYRLVYIMTMKCTINYTIMYPSLRYSTATHCTIL